MFLSRKALCPCLGQTYLAMMVVVKVIRSLYHGHVELTVGEGWLGGCPGRVLSKVPGRNRWQGQRIVDFNR